MHCLTRLSLLLVLAVSAVVITGCGKNAPAPSQLKISGGADQLALPGETYPGKLRLTVCDVKNNPCPDVKVKFAVRANSDLKLSANEAMSDAGGAVSITVTAGKKTGDQYIMAEAADCQPLQIRFVTGAKIIGANQEASVNSQLARPVKLQLVNGDGSPAAGVQVEFRSEKGKIRTPLTVTDKDGFASAELTVGPKTGRCDLTVSVNSATHNFAPVKVKSFAVDLWKIFINVLGGLALFIYGMTMMSNGLRHAAGEKMRGILRFFARNRIIGMLAGIGVTAAIQTSSGTTVMVVGFVNAGLMNLAQSISIMLGAHIGTTITAQLIAFKLNELIMPALITGLIISFFPGSKTKGWSETILGFGLLFFGITYMGTELKVISEFPSFIEFFRTFNCAPVGGTIPFGAVLGAIAIGMVMTMIIQSSSATSGIIIALCAGGLLDFYTSVALVFGANIGTTITAILASIPANRVAKQAALANTLCAVIGVIIVTGLFWIYWPGTRIPIFLYMIDYVTAGSAFGEIPQNLPRHVANAHTLFNIVTALILLPFTSLIAKLVEKIIPATGKVKYQYLEPHLLQQPAIAIEQTVIALRRMLTKSWKMVFRAGNCFIQGKIDDERIESLERKEKRIDKMQFEITDYLTKIMQHKLSAQQANVIPILMHCTNDAERIADHTENIINLIRRLDESGCKISETANKELSDLYSLLSEQAEYAITLLSKYDPEMVSRALNLERNINQLTDHYEGTHIQRLREQTCNAETGVIFIEMLNEVNKISARLSNFVERSGEINRCNAGQEPIADSE